MSAVHIPRGEAGVIRVFAISRPIASMARQLKQQPKAALASGLLAHPVTDDDFELFALSDLTGVGLPAYLRDGYDVDPTAIRRDRARLEALDGYVLLLFSRINTAGDVTLTPLADLTLIGSYAEPKPVHVAAPIAADAAKAYSGAKTATHGPARARLRGVLMMTSLLLTLFLIWWILR
jgi:hypothetical protein